MKKLMERMGYDKLDDATNMLKAVAHPLRMAIIDLLGNDKKMSVTSIFEALNIEQAVASHHLRVLKDRGVLSSEREGKKTYYFLRHKRLSLVVECVEKCCV